MKRTLRIFPLLAVLALLVAMTPASLSATTGALGREQAQEQDDWARIQQAGKIVFGTAADQPPFEFYNTRFELDGFDIALANALGEELGVDVEFNDYAFDGLLNTVRLGEVDAAIASISVTPDRQRLVDFTNLYFIGQTSAVAGESFTATIRSATDLTGATVGVQRGTTFQSWAQENLVDKKVIEQKNLLTYGSPSAMIRDLRTGTLDIGLMGHLTAASALRQHDDLRLVGDKFHQRQFAIAVPKGSNLSAQLNNALLTLQSSGVFAQLIEDYLQVQPTSVIPKAEAAVVQNVVVTTTVTVTATAAPCINSMAYVADLNLDDKNMTAPPVIAPGQNFAKGWRVRNSGNCAWDPNFTLAYANGNRIESSMGGRSVPMGRVVQPGESVDISVNLRAPQTYGVFQGFWQMRDTLGQAFGEIVWAGIQVPDPNPPAPPPPPADINPNLRADANYINPGQCTTIRWDVDNVAAVFLVDGGNSQGVSGHDARTVCPTATTTYVLRVTRQDGVNVDFPITINVGGGANAEYSINFWTDSTSIEGGQCTALRWDVRNVQAVFLDGEGVPGVSARDVCPGNTHTYALSVVKLDGAQDSRQVIIEVRNPAPQPPANQPPGIERFTVSDNEIILGECVRLEWRTDNADGVNLSRNGSNIVSGGPGNGSAEDCPSSGGLHEYRLDAYGYGSVAQTLTVNILTKQPR